MLLAASALAMPQLAHANARDDALEARLARLEAEVGALKSDLQAERAANAQLAAAAQAASTQASETSAKIAALEARPQAQPVPEGMRSGSTTLKIGGYLKFVGGSTRYSEGEVASNTAGRDFYLPQAIPVGNGTPSRVTDFSAKQSRFWVNIATDIAGHTLKGYLETDFETSPGTQGSQRTTNGYNLTLRRAFLQVDKWTFGQDWTTFQYTGALPESTDYVGTTEGTVFVRQALVRYSQPLSKELTLHVAVENPESGTANLGAPALIENGDDKLPDFTARLAYAGKLGELSLAGLGRQVRVQNAGVAADAAGYGISAAGKIYLNDKKSSDIRFMATYGQNIGRYVGLNFAPDAVLVPATGKLEDVRVFAAMGAARIALTPQLRVNVMGSYQTVDYADALALPGIATFNKRAWSAAANLFYSPIKNVDLGIEVRHGERRLVNGAEGNLDKVEIAAKYSF